uniref:WGS project CAEQ00000000 data, annotated contig 506 n=1 Tax=Trypanosoma congolense (strain IL3000) TaxID=1068625 RepID=F9WGI7_TRYCI|nr:unnamed protein product [Trypanosoma congolense IL3000]
MAAKRFVRAWRENSVRFPESNLLLVSHGDAISAVVDAVKPGYIVYETEYLSFVVLRRKGEQESALNSNRVFDLVTANGVQWLATQPEVSGDASVVSDHHDVSPQLPSDRIMDNPSGDLDNVPASSVNVRSLNTTTFIGVRVLVVASQIPAIEFWAVKANALTYVFAVTLLELIFVAINIFAELRPTILGTLARIEYFPAPRSNDYLALGEPNNRRRNPLSMVILLTAAALRSCITVIFAMLVFFVEDILSQTEFRLCAFIHEIFSWPLGIFLLGMLFWLNIVRMSFCVPRLLKREFGSR